MIFLNEHGRQKNALVNSLAYYFKSRYGFSSVTSEMLGEDVLKFIRIFNPDFIEEGQILLYVVSISEPPGKLLKDCQLVPVKLTLYHPEDTEYKKQNGLKELKLRIIQRITQEAFAQGGSLSQEDIANLLFLDRRTVVEYIKELESRGIKVVTRARLPQLLTRSLNKPQIIKMFFQGSSETEISSSTGYPKTYVEKYIDDFLRVILLYRQGITPSNIANLTGINTDLVKEYLTIYNRLISDEKLSTLVHKFLSFYEKPFLLKTLKVKEQFFSP